MRVGAAIRRLLLVVALTLGAAPALAISPDPELERLERALAQHPDDPDLLWAHARALARRGRSEEALAGLRAYGARFPDRRPDLDLELGRIQYQRGALPEALAALERALERDPEDATAHFYRGLALRELGRAEQAQAALARAGALSSALAPDSLLLQGVDLLDAGEDAAADDLFGRVIDLAPGSDAAGRARLLLLDRAPSPRERWLRLDAFAGFEWDSNVTLEDGGQPLGATAGDPLGSWGAAVTLRPWQGRRTAVEAGYLYDQNAHAEFEDYDLLGNSLWLSGSLRPWRALRLRLDVLGSDVRRDAAAYSRAGSLRASAGWAQGPRLGVSRVIASFTYRDYLEEFEGDGAELLTRDGSEWALGVSHSLPLWRRDAWLSAGFEYRRTDTEAAPDDAVGEALGGGSYDGSRFEGRLRAALPLPFDVSARGRLRVGHERFDHENFYILLEDLALERRSDVYGDLRLAFQREIAPYTRLELAWTGSLRRSNASSFTYDRQVVGLYFRVASE